MTPASPSPSTAIPYLHALEWATAGEPVVLATVVDTGGSAPRPAGSSMVIGAGGRIEGSVSGGCVEGDVIHAAREIMNGASPLVRTYGAGDNAGWGIGLACGTRLSVFIEAVRGPQTPHGTLPFPVLEKIGTHIRARENAVFLRTLDGLNHIVLEPGEQPPETLSCFPVASLARLPAGGSLCLEDDTGRAWFVQSIAPRPRLLVIGAVHIAQALTGMATIAGFATAVIDPRTALATPERFPGQQLIPEWPDEALLTLGLDATTAVVTLTHDRKLDDPALLVAAPSPAFYVGALGSRSTQAARLTRLRDEGLADEALARIRGPVGLPIGAVDAEEIAVAILADIIATRRGAPLATHSAWWSPFAGTKDRKPGCIPDRKETTP